MGDIPPNQTLYVNNLNEKIKVPELKCCLTELFGSYGEVIDIIAFGTLKKKGQAFAVFRDISCATNAMRALQGFVFLDKPLKIAYCKSKSDVVAQEDGTFKPRMKNSKRWKRTNPRLLVRKLKQSQRKQPVERPLRHRWQNLPLLLLLLARLQRRSRRAEVLKRMDSHPTSFLWKTCLQRSTK